MQSSILVASLENNRMKLSGVLDDSEESKNTLTRVFDELLEEVRVADIVDRPNEPYVIDASELIVAYGGLGTWFKFVNDKLSMITLHYEQSLLAELMQFASTHNTHPGTTFLCRVEHLIDKKRLEERAKMLVKKYHFVLELEGATWISSSLEIPTAFAEGSTVDECMKRSLEMHAIVVAMLLEHGHTPPAPKKDWRRPKE